MAKQLKDILKQAHDTIKGVRPSTTTDGSTGTDPGVDYKPKAGDEADFVAKHSVNKVDDVNGNGAGVFTSSKGEAPYKKQSKGVYESKKAEDVKCNNTPAKTWCPMHEMADCTMTKNIKEEDLEEVSIVGASKINNFAYSKKGKENRAAYITKQKATYDPVEKKKADIKAKNLATLKAVSAKKKAMDEEAEQIDELSNATLGSYKTKAADSEKAMTDKSSTLSVPAKDRNAAAVKANQRRQGMKLATAKMSEEVEQIDEVLTKSTTAGETIHDFVHSKNPKFAGKSKEKRKQMALAAYYAKQRNEEVEVIDELSKATMGSYVKKSSQDLKNLEAGREKGEGFEKHVARNRTQDNRTKGINRAVGKLTKESYAVEPLLGSTEPRGDSDEAAEMVKSELKALANKAVHLVSQMPDNMHVEPWVQAKIATAKELVSSVHDYMIYGDHDKETEQTDTPMTLPGMNQDNALGQNV